VPKESLNGYWTNKSNSNIYVFIEKTFKKGYVTGFEYEKLSDGGEKIFAGGFNCTVEDLKEHFERGLKR
jgi:hypothetical protein